MSAMCSWYSSRDFLTLVLPPILNWSDFHRFLFPGVPNPRLLGYTKSRSVQCPNFCIGIACCRSMLCINMGWCPPCKGLELVEKGLTLAVMKLCGSAIHLDSEVCWVHKSALKSRAGVLLYSLNVGVTGPT